VFRRRTSWLNLMRGSGSFIILTAFMFMFCSFASARQNVAAGQTSAKYAGADRKTKNGLNSFRKNGGDDGTRTRGLCRDSAQG